VSRVFKGVGVSSGVARGVAFVLACGDRGVSPRRDIQPMEVGGERVRLEAALEAAISELTALQRDVGARIGPTQADILGAQALVLRDPHSILAWSRRSASTWRPRSRT
jgi:phosphoenolpyruvate-protein kinase (PTS system EI component)